MNVSHLEVVGMHLMRKAHGAGKGVVPGALVVDAVALRIGSASISARSGAVTRPTTARAARAESYARASAAALPARRALRAQQECYAGSPAGLVRRAETAARIAIVRAFFKDN
ncbi:MAG TPA: hypothetical protein VKF35_25900 [Hyphomicrobiaceae bacterium]|nr:hypothetical protein [Hyphomicrobiaceae bacterium]